VGWGVPRCSRVRAYWRMSMSVIVMFGACLWWWWVGWVREGVTASRREIAVRNFIVILLRLDGF